MWDRPCALAYTFELVKIMMPCTEFNWGSFALNHSWHIGK